MTKSKVGAEPKGRVKHVFTKDAGIHEGIHRDEPGCIIVIIITIVLVMVISFI